MRKAVSAAAAISTAGTLPVFMLSAQAVLIRDDLHLTAAHLGAALTAFYVASAATSPLSGAVAGRVGARGSNLAAGLLATASLALIALNGGSYALLLLAMVLGGGSNSLAQVSSNQLLAGMVPPRRMGLAFGIKQSAVPIATLCGGLAVPVFGATIGWRWGVSVALLLCLAIAIFASRSAAPRQVAPVAPVARQRLILMPLVVIAIATALASSAMNAHASFLVLWATDQGIAVGTAGMVLALASVSSIAARIGSGWLADRRGGRNLSMVALQVAIGAVGLALVATGAPIAIVIGAVLAFGIGWSWPGLLMLAVVKALPSREAGATGVIQTGAFTGAALGPLLFGVIAEAFSFQAAWALGVVSLSLSAVIFLLGRALIVKAVDRERGRVLSPPTSVA